MDMLDDYISAVINGGQTGHQKFHHCRQGGKNSIQGFFLLPSMHFSYICNQIGKMFPNLTAGYTEEGDAILSLKGNVEQLQDAYKGAQQEAYNLLKPGDKKSGGDDIIQNWKIFIRPAFSLCCLTWEEMILGEMYLNQIFRLDTIPSLEFSPGSLGRNSADTEEFYEELNWGEKLVARTSSALNKLNDKVSGTCISWSLPSSGRQSPLSLCKNCK